VSFNEFVELKRYKPVYTYTGMICGLPGEPLSSVYNSQKILLEQNFEVFDNWDWWPLVIRKNSVSRLSEFEKEYDKWGYTEMTHGDYTLSKDDNDTRYNNDDSNMMMWKNKYMNYLSARKIATLLNLETEEHRIKAGKSIYGNADKGVSINHDVFELVGMGVDVKDIIDGTFDKSFLNRKIKEADQTILEYKNLKLGI